MSDDDHKLVIDDIHEFHFCKSVDIRSGDSSSRIDQLFVDIFRNVIVKWIRGFDDYWLNCDELEDWEAACILINLNPDELDTYRSGVDAVHLFRYGLIDMPNLSSDEREYHHELGIALGKHYDWLLLEIYEETLQLIRRAINSGSLKYTQSSKIF